MNTYIIKIFPFPHVMGRDKIVQIQSKEDLDTVLQKLKNKLEKENPMYEYDLIGFTIDDFLNEIEIVKLQN